MLGRFVDLHPGPKVPRHLPVKDFHHEREERASEGRVPATLRLLIANKCVLGLDFEELEIAQLVPECTLCPVENLPSRSRLRPPESFG
jgi:hypothetical protein